EPDGLFELIDQGRAGHAGASVNQHGAGAADFLETVGVVRDGRSGFAFTGDRVGGDLHQRRDHVHAWVPGKFEFLPVGTDVRVRLAFDLEDYGLGISHVLLAQTT